MVSINYWCIINVSVVFLNTFVYAEDLQCYVCTNCATVDDSYRQTCTKPDVPTDAPSTDASTTYASTTYASTTDVPTTDAPTTNASTRDASTTDPSTTDATMTDQTSTDTAVTGTPTTDITTTDEANTSETNAPTTEVPVTEAPPTSPSAPDVIVTRTLPTFPPTNSPTTYAPTTDAFTTNAPTTDFPVTNTPVTEASTTDTPTTDASTTDVPTTNGAVKDVQTTNAPVTDASTEDASTSNAPTTEVSTEAVTTDISTIDISTMDISTTTEPAEDNKNSDVPLIYKEQPIYKVEMLDNGRSRRALLRTLREIKSGETNGTRCIVASFVENGTTTVVRGCSFESGNSQDRCREVIGGKFAGDIKRCDVCEGNLCNSAAISGIALTPLLLAIFLSI